MTRLSMQFCLYLRALDQWESEQCFLWPSIVLDYFECFCGLEKGFTEKMSCESKCLFAHH